MTARLHCPGPLASGQHLSLPEGAARHVQVLRMQPGMTVTLFNGEGGQYQAEILRMGRSEVQVLVGEHIALERETARPVHLAMGMPANERMDWLVEKAAELGVASIQPLVMERSVLRMSGERAERKRAHWQAVAVAACEQCGRNRVPDIGAVQTLAQWFATRPAADKQALVLSLHESALPLGQRVPPGTRPVLLLSGPEGGLSPAEEQQALALGFAATSLGERTLRAETAPLAALAALTLGS